MFGSLTSAIISVLSYFSSAEQLQQYIFWGFGNLGDLSWRELSIMASFFLPGSSPQEEEELLLVLLHCCFSFFLAALL